MSSHGREDINNDFALKSEMLYSNDALDKALAGDEYSNAAKAKIQAEINRRAAVKKQSEALSVAVAAQQRDLDLAQGQQGRKGTILTTPDDSVESAMKKGTILTQ